MFWTILRFELAFHRRRPSTYLYFATMFLLAFFGVASTAVQFAGGRGQVMRNAPFVLAQMMTILTALGQVITTALVGTAILRDVQVKSHELLFTTRLTRTGYLAGRFVGVYLVMLAVYAGLPLGAFVGTLMPWVDHEQLQAFHLASYLQPFLLIVVPNILFVSALFFAVGALTRNLFAIYVQGIALFVAWSVSQQILTDLDNLKLASLVDSFGASTVGLATRYWTVAEKNSQLIPLAGPVLWNRLLWVAIAAAILGLALAFVRLEVEPRSLTLRGWRRRATAPEVPVGPGRAGVATALPAVGLHFDALARVRQLAGLARFFFISIVREPVFLAIAVFNVINVAFGAWYTDNQYGTPIWPVTAEMTRYIVGGTTLFIILLTTIYAGDLVWRERQLRADGATDALPVPTGIVQVGKILGFLGALAVMMGTTLLATIAVQTIKGYHHYELGLYGEALLGIVAPVMVQLTLLAFFVHSLVNNKYVGHVVMIVFYVLLLVLNSWGFQRVLYQYGLPPDYIYSDMNGFGHYAPFLRWLLAYYTALGLMLGVVAYLFAVRGSDDDLRARWRTARSRLRSRGPRLAGGASALATVAAGGVVFFNTAVRNPYASSKDLERRRAVYERTYHRFKKMAAPRIVAVHVQADLVPERRAFVLHSVYRVVNKQPRALDSLFVEVSTVDFGGSVGGDVWGSPGYRVDSLTWSRPTTALVTDSSAGVFLYRLATPLAPGDTMTLAFASHFTASGFPNARPNNDIVANGTFLNSGYFPTLAYDENVELGDDDKRKEQGLGPKERAPSIHDQAARANSALSMDADWIAFDAVISTAPGQIAIAPGYLQREWTQDGRRFFAYHMDVPILNFYSIQSARYNVLREQYKGVAIEVYYHPGHEFDLDRMVQATKRGLDYYTAHFSPYQFRQYRIIEFPRYQDFAQSFPNTVPFSEGIGFVARVRDTDDDLDMPLFVTAHELAHQWWGHQIVPANVQGASMLVESLAEYSALTVMEHKYGASRAQKFLRYELDRYLRGRSVERKKEMPLMLVENQPYIHYNKGSLAFFALRDYIGEDALNAALSRFVRDKAFQTAPYTTTEEFLQYIRAVTPDSLQYVIHDLFETITLYDNKAVAATATKRPDDNYTVHLTVSAKKLRADSLGNQTEIPVADYIDVGVFGDPERGNKLGKPLSVRKIHMTQPETTVDITVHGRPRKAGIDPYNKLIDRAPEDNVRSVDITG